MKHSGLQRARQSTRKKMKKSLGPDFVDPSNLGLHGKETSSDVRCDICHEGLPINFKKDCITCKKCAIRAHAACIRTQLNVKYIKSLWLCVNCRHCYECDKSGVDQSELVFCRSCERSYHFDCMGNKNNGNGKAICYRCAKPSVINTKNSQISTTSATTTPTTSATSTASNTATTTTPGTPNGVSSVRISARKGRTGRPPNTPSTISSNPSTSSSSSTPTPSTSRAYQIKKEMIIEKQRPKSNSNNPNNHQVRSDHFEISQTSRVELPPRQEKFDLHEILRRNQEKTLDDLKKEFSDTSWIDNAREMFSNSKRFVDLPDAIRDAKVQENLERMKNLREKTFDYRAKKIIEREKLRGKNIDLPDTELPVFSYKMLLRDQNDKSTDRSRVMNEGEPERENDSEDTKELKDKGEKQSTIEDRKELSTENSRNSLNVNKTNGTGTRCASPLHELAGDENEHSKAPHPIPSRLNLPEKRKANELQGSGFVLSKPIELTEETAKLLKDSNGARKLKLVLFERACKAESLLPAETSIWTTEDVFNFIRFIGFPDAADNFLDHQIDGKSLLLLSRRDVLTGFKLKLGPALKIYAHIFRLQRKRPALLLED